MPETTEKKDEKAAAPQGDAFPKERLIGEAAAFFSGEFAPHEVAGGLSGVKKAQVTVAEARTATNKWLQSEVKG